MPDTALDAWDSARAYFAFQVCYGVLTAAIFLIPVVLINFKITFQSILVAFPLWCAGVHVGLAPNDSTGLVRRKMRVAFCTGAFISIVFLLYALINPFTILLSECPAHSNDWRRNEMDWENRRISFSSLKGVANSDASMRPSRNRLDVIVRYDAMHHTTNGGDEKFTQHVLLLKYNVTHREIVRRQLAPASRRSGKRSWLQEKREQYRLKTQPICSDDGASQFHFLEAEITRALEERHTTAQASKSVLHLNAHHHPGAPESEGDWDEEEEEGVTLTLWVREICRKEMGFLVVYIVFIFITIIFQLVALFWYALYVKDG
jgi:hypothetical protein